MWGWLGLAVTAMGVVFLMGADPSYFPIIGASVAAQYGTGALLLCIAAIAAALGFLSPSHSMPRQASIWGALGLSVIVVFTHIDEFGGAVVQTAAPSQAADADTGETLETTGLEAPAETDEPSDGQSEEPSANVSTELKADSRGHFLTDAEIDGTAVKVMVDTGASAVALSYEDADDVGLRPRTLDYDVPVSTANGVVNAARVSLRRVEIDGIQVRDVEGLVLPEGVLRGTLLGMSFLSRLRSFKVEDGVLYLED